jgi:hypothetical protein
VSTYKGHDVLQLDYNRLGAFQERHRRRFVLLDSQTGLRHADEHSPAPAPARPFTWTAIGDDEIATMRAFLDARKGRAVPFWLPTFQWDLSLAQDVVETQAIITIHYVRYVQQMWGTTGARRHLAIWTLGEGIMDFYGVEDSNDPGDYLTETLTLDTPAVRDYPAQQRVISFLKFCRLETDRVELSYPVPGVAEATIRTRELPNEAVIPT